MKNHNAIIKDVAYYHPDNAVDNEYFIKHFDKQGIDIRDSLKRAGRKSRYLSTDPNETGLTMGLKAAQAVLKKADVDPKDLNIVIFASEIPEYVCPPNAAKIHEFIKAGQKCSTYDLNANCAGMLVALEQVSRNMRDNPYLKYALIVGAEDGNKYSSFDNPIPYANFGDCGCAIILENVYGTSNGFIDSDAYTNTVNHDKILFPPKGTSSLVHSNDLKAEDKLTQWSHFDSHGIFYSSTISIKEVLSRNNLSMKDIKKYFLSQVSLERITFICNELGEDINKFAYIGDEFGYTGPTSPLLAFAKTIEKGELEKDDYVIFWTVGSGHTCSCILYKY